MFATTNIHINHQDGAYQSHSRSHRQIQLNPFNQTAVTQASLDLRLQLGPTHLRFIGTPVLCRINALGAQEENQP